jgi:hypothetical protein
MIGDLEYRNRRKTVQKEIVKVVMTSLETELQAG